jgi:transcriptional regulator with XRE-family HTH domain
MTENITKYLAANTLYLRKKRNLSQKQLADLAEIPRTTLTNMESGSGNPSLTNLVKLATALKISIESLLSRPRTECHLVKSDDVPVNLKSAGRVQMYKLLPDKIKGLEIDRIEIDGGATMGGHPHLPGTKEYMTVIKGELTIHLAGESYIVKKNDVFAFPGNQPHSYRNNRNTQSIALSVVIPIPASL